MHVLIGGGSGFIGSALTARLRALGLGAVMGHGRQPVPWIHIEDAVGVHPSP